MNTLYDTQPYVDHAFSVTHPWYTGAFTDLLDDLAVKTDAVQLLRSCLLNARTQLCAGSGYGCPCRGRGGRREAQATALVRGQARQGARVVSLWHENIVLDDIARRLLPLLYGSCDHAALLAAICHTTLERSMQRGVRLYWRLLYSA